MELLSQERLELLLSWRHSGFSVHNDVRLPAGDTKALEVLVRYMSRPAVSLARLVLQPDSDEVLYFPKPEGHDGNAAGPEHIDALEFVASVLAQIPEPRKHLVRYYGYYSNAARGKRRKLDQPAEAEDSAAVDPTPSEVSRRTSPTLTAWIQTGQFIARSRAFFSFLKPPNRSQKPCRQLPRRLSLRR